MDTRWGKAHPNWAGFANLVMLVFVWIPLLYAAAIALVWAVGMLWSGGRLPWPAQ
jgi:hypothetical protein